MLSRIFTPQQIARMRTNGQEDFTGNHVPAALLRNPFGAGVWLFTALYPGSDDRLWALADLGAGEPATGEVNITDLAAHFGDLGYLPSADSEFDAGARPLSQFAHQARRDGALQPETVLTEPAWTFEPGPNDDHVWRRMTLDGPGGPRDVTVLAMYYLTDDQGPLNTVLLCRNQTGDLELHEHAADGLHDRGAPDPAELAELKHVEPGEKGILLGRTVSRTDDEDLSDYVRFNTLEASERANLD